MRASLPEPLEAEIEAIRARVDEPAEALMPMLRAVQRSLGWLSDDVLRDVAARAGVEVEDAINVAGYFDLRREPPAARHVVEVCVNVNCQRRGGEAILTRCRARLGLEIGETSPDGRFSLQEIVCLKRCESGPAIRVSGEILDELTAERLDVILGALEREPAG